MQTTTTKKKTVANATSITLGRFTLRLVKKGEFYGRDFCIEHTKGEPLVEFYDTFHPLTQFGQFVQRYNYSTFMSIPHNQGLDLYGGENDWKIGYKDVNSFKFMLDAMGRF